MPDQLIDPAKKPEENRWHQTFAPCYAPPQTITGEHEWVQWHRRMIYHSFSAMQSRFQDTVTKWRESFTRLESPTAEKHCIWAEITGGFRPIPAGDCHFGADPPEPGRVIQVEAFQLHQYPVTNEMYELFDPAHKANRWASGSHPLAKKKQGGDDPCPVVNVTWYDAWCFAAWCGYRLPTEEQWEHACRGGTAFRFSFGNEEDELRDHAWFYMNSDLMTHPVGERPIAGKKRTHELFDMHGNVWEWCESWNDSEQVYRVLRGGSWGDSARYCRAANRGRYGPGYGSRGIGFRLCLPGPD
jgi:formylglycine-generating enzyme required for sulfatase activity